MPTKPITLIKGDKVSQNTDYRDFLPQNMIAIQREIFGAKGYMLCYPGLTKYADGTNIDRGAMYNENFGIHFRVSGKKLIKVNYDGTTTELGDIPGSSQVEMTYSFNTHAIVADGKLFLYSLADGFTEVTDADLGSPLDIVWIDGYYFMTDGDYIFHTDLSDETSIDPLKFATAEFMPDQSKGVGKTSDNKAIVFGRYSMEYFSDTANANFAFTRIETRALKKGIVGTHAKCEVDGKWFLCGGGKKDSIIIYIVQSGFIDKISTREIDKILSEYKESELENMRIESTNKDNIVFVLMHLPNETLCFNDTIAKNIGKEHAWSILKSGVNPGDNYRAINGVFDPNLGQWIYGDKRNQFIGIHDNTVFSHYNEINEWILYSPLINLETMSIDEIDIETIPGFTALLDAKVGISLTYDGFTFGKEWFEMYGEPSDYGKRFIIQRLGYVADNVVFKFRGATKSRMAFSMFKVTYS